MDTEGRLSATSWGMLRRCFFCPSAGGVFGAFAIGGSARAVSSWQPPAKRQFRLSKSALVQSRQRHHVQKKVALLRQHINEEYGMRQRECAQLRRRCERTATALIHNASRAPAGSATSALETARHLFAMHEATRKAMKGGKSERKAMFTGSKKWRG